MKMLKGKKLLAVKWKRGWLAAEQNEKTKKKMASVVIHKR